MLSCRLDKFRQFVLLAHTAAAERVFRKPFPLISNPFIFWELMFFFLWVPLRYFQITSGFAHLVTAKMFHFWQFNSISLTCKTKFEYLWIYLEICLFDFLFELSSQWLEQVSILKFYRKLQSLNGSDILKISDHGNSPNKSE